jgi:hypothetical protein
VGELARLLCSVLILSSELNNACFGALDSFRALPLRVGLQGIWRAQGDSYTEYQCSLKTNLTMMTVCRTIIHELTQTVLNTFIFLDKVIFGIPKVGKCRLIIWR